MTNAAAASGLVSGNDFDNRVFVTQENAARTIYLSDLPRTVSYIELAEFFESKVGPCMISIKRPLFKTFYYAFIQFQKLDHANKALAEFRFPEFGGVKCRALPFNKQAIHSTEGGKQ